MSNAKPRMAAVLCMVTANLLSASLASAQTTNDGASSAVPADLPANHNAYDEPADELGTTSIDSAVLYYKESNGRVQAIEPMVSITHTTKSGRVLSGKVTFDSLTGATPNGATPWSGAQTFVAPAGGGGEHGLTGASGTLVRNPVTGVQERRYTAAPNTLPVDQAFRDSRVAVDLGYSTPITANTKLNIGVNGSVEQDYRSLSGRIGIAQDLNNKSTTLSLGVNFEQDQSKPFHGIPVALSPMSGTPAAARSRNKNVINAVAGITQVLTPNLVVQLNYSYGSSKGYHSDPYRILSVLDPTTGAPLRYVYEGRPDKRTRQSVYGAAKLATGSFVTDLSARYYHDSWGINSYTVELAEHVPLMSKAYIEPRVRYYHQSKADFFAYYLPSTAALPLFASSDSRLDRFNAITFGVSGGVELTPHLELYANVETYRQSKSGALGTVPAGIANQKLYSGTHAMSGLFGIKFKF
jgi:opacity protein-like surface antigen